MATELKQPPLGAFRAEDPCISPKMNEFCLRESDLHPSLGC